MNSNYIKCPACKNYLDATNIKLKENTLIYCYNCNTYFNYTTNSYITVVKKEVSRGSRNGISISN